MKKNATNSKDNRELFTEKRHMKKKEHKPAPAAPTAPIIPTIFDVQN